MATEKKYFFVLAIFNGKDTSYKKYLTLKGIEKRIGCKIENPFRQINYGANIVFEGSDGTNKLTIFREFKG